MREELRKVLADKIRPIVYEVVGSFSAALSKAFFEGVEVGLIKGLESKGLVEDDD